MSATRLQNRLQIAGFVGVIAGLLLVAYEARQANEIAKAEAIRAMYDGFDTLQESAISNDIHGLYIRSFGKPHSLTDEEALKYCDWLILAMHQYDRQMTMQQLDLMPFDAVGNLMSSFDYYFSSDLSRSCYRGAIRPWMESELSEALDREMQTKPPLPTYPGMQ